MLNTATGAFTSVSAVYLSNRWEFIINLCWQACFVANQHWVFVFRLMQRQLWAGPHAHVFFGLTVTVVLALCCCRELELNLLHQCVCVKRLSKHGEYTTCPHTGLTVPQEPVGFYIQCLAWIAFWRVTACVWWHIFVFADMLLNGSEWQKQQCVFA